MEDFPMQETATANARRALTATLLFAALGGPAWADKPEGKGHGKNKNRKDKHDKHDDRDGKRERREPRVGAYFNEHDRVAVRGYYDERYGGGRKGCPPGLAKKNNGCLPPGQAKKYAIGQRLPAGVVYYPVPQPVLVQLPPAPAGHKYVRIAADILLIAVGTSLVVDAMTDLGRM
jgi:Ni/Co efflux regulator RcnB